MPERPDAVPAVSVVIPFYDSVGVLGRALASVRAQQPCGTVEVIVVVDGSHEDLTEVVAANPDAVFLHVENGGPGLARNRGIELARGEFVAFLDADDYWRPEKLRTQLSEMRRESAEWSQHSFSVVDPDGVVLRTVDTSHYVGDVVMSTLLSFRVQTSTIMVKRSVFADPEMRFGRDRVGEDGHLYMRLAARYPLVAVQKDLGFFTWHGANAGADPGVQLWSRGQIWRRTRHVVRDTLPFLGVAAYAWCDFSTRLLRYDRQDPPLRGRHIAAKVLYLPSYLVFRFLAKRVNQ